MKKEPDLRHKQRARVALLKEIAAEVNKRGKAKAKKKPPIVDLVDTTPVLPDTNSTSKKKKKGMGDSTHIPVAKQPEGGSGDYIEVDEAVKQLRSVLDDDTDTIEGKIIDIGKACMCNSAPCSCGMDSDRDGLEDIEEEGSEGEDTPYTENSSKVLGPSTIDEETNSSAIARGQQALMLVRLDNQRLREGLKTKFIEETFATLSRLNAGITLSKISDSQLYYIAKAAEILGKNVSEVMGGSPTLVVSQEQTAVFGEMDDDALEGTAQKRLKSISKRLTASRKD